MEMVGMVIKIVQFRSRKSRSVTFCQMGEFVTCIPRKYIFDEQVKKSHFWQTSSGSSQHSLKKEGLFQTSLKKQPPPKPPTPGPPSPRTAPPCPGLGGGREYLFEVVWKHNKCAFQTILKRPRASFSKIPMLSCYQKTTFREGRHTPCIRAANYSASRYKQLFNYPLYPCPPTPKQHLQMRLGDSDTWKW